MRILLTNDDGILAPGLAAMHDELGAIGDVVVAAPASVQSASGHGITIHEPISARWMHAHNRFYGWAIDGRPADCVKLAVGELVDPRPDLVVSGINDGANIAINVLYSGTVAAAAEGAILGIPAVAVSLEWGDEMDFTRAAKIAAGIVKRYADTVASGKPVCPLLNVNIPELTGDRPVGLRVVPQSVVGAPDEFTPVESEDRSDGGSRRYRLSGWYSDFGPPQYDLGSIREGYVVLTPLHFDMTDHERMASVRDLDWPDPTR